MKHRIFCAILCLVVLVPVRAQAAIFQDVQYVVDQADILTDQENMELDGLAKTLSQTYQLDILIAAVDDMNGMSAQEYAVSLNSDRGWWDTDQAVLFLIAMEEREWYIATFGDAIYIFTDYGLDRLGEAAVLSFSEGSYYDGFAAYLNMLPEYFQSWERGEPIDSYSYDPGPREEVVYGTPVQTKTIWSVLPVSLLIGIVAAAIILLVMRSSMNTKRRQYSAGDYLKPGSYHLRTQQDLFLYSNLSKTRRQENTGGPGGRSGGGSSIHRSSGGRSHGGRGGKF